MSRTTRNGKIDSHDMAEKLTDKILAFLKDNPGGSTLPMIERHCGGDSAATANVVTFLCNEGYVKCKNLIFLIADNN